MLKNLIFLGPPGAGKGTVAALIVEQQGLLHISTGNIFREAVSNQTELGKVVGPIMAKGDLVPNDLTNQLVANRFTQDDVRMQGFILDGYPRTVDQANFLKDVTRLDAVINFTVDTAEVVRRLSGRRVCTNKECGAIYHIDHYKNSTCEKCGSPLIQRDDDKAEAIEKRLIEYERKTAPLITYYQKEGLLKDLNSMQTPSQVASDLLKLIQ